MDKALLLINSHLIARVFIHYIVKAIRSDIVLIKKLPNKEQLLITFINGNLNHLKSEIIVHVIDDNEVLVLFITLMKVVSKTISFKNISRYLACSFMLQLSIIGFVRQCCKD